MNVYKALDENSNMTVNEETTRKTDEDMEKISEGKESADTVLAEGKAMLIEALKIFDERKRRVRKGDAGAC